MIMNTPPPLHARMLGVYICIQGLTTPAERDVLAWKEPLAASTNEQQCDSDDNLTSGTDGTTTERTLRARERGLVMLERVLAEATVRTLAAKVRRGLYGIMEFETYYAVEFGCSWGAELEQWARLNAKARELTRDFQEKAKEYTEEFQDPVGMWLI